MRRFLRRPSPALVLAGVAVVLALGGTATAARLISGKSIRRGSIPANRIQKNALTGKQIRETTLGVVRHARRADIARGAANANTVANLGFGKLVFRSARGGAETKVADSLGLQIYASCSSASKPAIRAVSQLGATRIQVGVIGAGTNRSSGGVDGSFSPGESVDLDRGFTAGQGTLTWLRGDNQQVTITYGFDGCTLSGFVNGG